MRQTVTWKKQSRFLRKNGEAKAVKKAGRIAAEGIVMAEVRDDKNSSNR